MRSNRGKAWIVWIHCVSFACLGLSGHALGSELYPEKVVQLPAEDQPLYPVGDNHYRTFVVSHDLPSKSGEPVIVIAREHEVWYLDCASLEIIRKNVYGSNESAVISSNGMYVAVVSHSENRSTGQTMRKVRIEDWTGQTLWEMPAAMRGKIEPTPQGGFIAYPTSLWNQDDYLLAPDKLVPRRVPHGLKVYDPEGNLILEGVSHEEIAFGSRGYLSPEGGYLALAFSWVAPENRSGHNRTLGDKGYLVLYDLKLGTKLWDKYFDGLHVGAVVVGPGAERILCFASLDDYTSPRPYRLHLFDRDGRSLLDDRDHLEKVHGPLVTALSPDGSLCAFVSDLYSIVRVIRMDDGSLLSHYKRPADLTTTTIRGLTNDGRLVLLGTRKLEAGYEREILIVERDGRLADRFDSDNIRTGGIIYHGAVSEDGKVFWLVQGSTLARYVNGFQAGD